MARLVNEDGWDPKSDVEGVGVDARGSCALHWAAGEGHVDIVRYLVDVVGEDPRRAQTKRDRRGAMHWAARERPRGRHAMADERGARGRRRADDGRDDAVHARDVEGRVDRDAMARGRRGGGPDRAERVRGCNAAQWAAMNGDVEALELLAELGVDVGVLNRNGHSALHKAATKGAAGGRASG